MRDARRRPVLRFFAECVRPYAWLQVEIALTMLIGVALTLVDPLILKVVLDRALGDGDRGLLALLAGLLAVVLLFRVAFRVLGVWLTSYSGLRILFDFRARAFEHVESLPPAFFRGERFGDVLARLTSDIEVLQRAAAHTLVNAAQDLLSIAGILAALFWLDPLLAGVLVAVYPFLAAGLAAINGRLRSEGTRAREAMGGLYTFLEERLAAVRLVQEFSREKAEARRHVRVSRPWISSNLNLSVLGSVQVSLADLMTTGAFVLVFLLGGWRTIDGQLTVGGLVAFYTLATRLYRPVSGLVDVNVDLQVATSSLERVYALLDTEPSIAELPDASVPEPGPDGAGALRLRGVDLSFPDGTRVLDGVDLQVPPGAVVALVGPSGSGKSTLASLAARYLDPVAGSVELDGLDLRRWKLRALRRSVTLVPQETRLFHDSLAANLRFAKPDASDEELIDALHAVELGELLASLPEGLDTTVGEQGLRLSGGERQRLALARALLKPARLVILDEATSALDSRTERVVLDRLLARWAACTVIVIAHRLTTLTEVDRIVVLDRGRVVELGTHDELVETAGLYRSLYEEQTRGNRPRAVR